MMIVWGIFILILGTTGVQGETIPDKNNDYEEPEATTSKKEGGENPFQKMEIEERIKAVFEHFRDDDPKGIPGYKIPDPLDVPDASPDVGGSTLKLTESQLHGLSKIRVGHVRVDLVGMKVEIRLEFPELFMQGRYKISSWLSSSIGPYNMSVIGVTAEGATELGVDPDGKINVKEVNLDLKFKDLKMNFENLGFFGSIFQAILNSLVPTLFESVKPVILAQINSKVQSEVNQQMRSLDVVLYDSIAPIDKFFVDARKEIRNLGYEPYPMTELYIPIFGAAEDREFSDYLDSNVLVLTEGQLSGISTIHRTDNITVAYDHLTKSVTASFGAGLVKCGLKYNWELKTRWYTRSGSIDFTTDGLKIGTTLTQPANIDNPPVIKSLSIALGNIQIKTEGKAALNYLVEFTVNAGINGMRHIIMAATQEVARLVINQELKKLNLENLITEEIRKRQSEVVEE